MSPDNLYIRDAKYLEVIKALDELGVKLRVELPVGIDLAQFERYMTGDSP